MAFQNFYMTSTGNDLNAGSSTANSADVTDVGGAYGQGTGAGGNDQYVAVGGTPFSAVSVGDWASVYTAGATVGTFSGKVTAINAGGLSIDISLTAIMGVRPANASTKTVKINGAFTSLALVASGKTLASGTVGVSTKINVKAAQYSQGATGATFAMGGTTLAPIWWSGYTTNPGDLDTGAPAASAIDGSVKPWFSFTSGAMIISTVGHQIWSNIDITSTSTTAAALQLTTGALLGHEFHRLRIKNTGANAASGAVLYNNAQYCSFYECWFNTTTTASYIFDIGVTASSPSLLGCVFRGGKTSLRLMDVSTAPGGVVCNCVFDGPSTYGIEIPVASTSVSDLFINGNSFYACGTDAIRITALPTSGFIIISNNVFNSSGTYDINNSSGTNTNVVKRHNNETYNPGTTSEHGFGDSPAWNATTDGAASFTSGSGHDFSLVLGSTARNAAIPGLFEAGASETNQTYGDRGAVRHIDPAGGAATPYVIGS